MNHTYKSNPSIKPKEPVLKNENAVKKPLYESRLITKKPSKQVFGPPKIPKGQQPKKIKLAQDGHKEFLDDSKEIAERLRKIMKVVESEERQEDPAEIKLQKIKKILGLQKSSQKKIPASVRGSIQTQDSSRDYLDDEKKSVQKPESSNKTFDCKQIKRSIYKKYGFRQTVDTKALKLAFLDDTEAKDSLCPENENLLDFTDDTEQKANQLIQEFQLASSKIKEQLKSQVKIKSQVKQTGTARQTRSASKQKSSKKKESLKKQQTAEKQNEKIEIEVEIQI